MDSVTSGASQSVEFPTLSQESQAETEQPNTEAPQKEEENSGNGSSEPQKQTPKEAAEKALEKQKLKFKSKIDGQEIEEEVDYDEVARDRQRWKAADRRFEEAANLKKEAFEIIKYGQTKDGVIDLIKKFGFDPRELAEEYLANQLQMEMMTPEQRENYELKRQLYERDKAAKLEQAQREQKVEAEATERIKTQMQSEIIETLKGSGLPQTTESVKRIAYHMSKYLQRGMDITPKDVVPDVIDEIKTYTQMLLKQMPIQKLVEVIGEEKAKEWRAHDLSRVKDPLRPQPKEPSQFPEIKKTQKGYVTDRDFEQHLKRVKSTGG